MREASKYRTVCRNKHVTNLICSCSVNWHQQQQQQHRLSDVIEGDFVASFNGRSYIVFMFVMGLVVPLGIVVACYICILHVLHKV